MGDFYLLTPTHKATLQTFLACKVVLFICSSNLRVYCIVQQ